MAYDDYDLYDDFGTLNDADFATLDALCAEAIADNASAAMPSISIEIESATSTADSQTSNSRTSPMARYRRQGTLSVTDITSLAWCEVQLDYGLQQKRSRRLADRPRSFRSERTGKEIVVQQQVAARNEQTTNRGRFIHKELEMELKAEEVQIRITSEEERWGLRILNFITSLSSLQAENCVREIPIFGLIEGIAVVGIADELRIEKDGNISTIHLIDTKTRRTDSLPPEEDTVPTKIQLMLYHRLLGILLDPSQQFDYLAFWNQLSLDPGRLFSEVFKAQMRPILGTIEALPSCLADLCMLLDLRVADMRLPPLNHDLTVIYRSQRKYPAPLRPSNTLVVHGESEEEELARAILMSIASEAESAQMAQFQEELQKALRSCQLEHGRSSLQSPTASAVIGTKRFPMDEVRLEEYLHSAIQWWTGHRRARGVTEAQTSRCFSCEYVDGCEWRELKANEKLKLAEARRRRAARAELTMLR
ncbi:hypothetical protein MIND_00554300 [Mycena indigotica]|uniref:Exonuclease V n=1 Tax=Mycena indigotica TaxID=2126181 RepID=A0A8H6WAF6_9AGAR|nr:uncharacterized protein MIND_00554300 [Mycena indigotica]KAF7307593.1 hypothetical protein MIND_00554300 [Mycena indigotica]